MNKKFTCAFTLAAILLSAANSLAAPPQSPFSDVPAKHWAYEAVATLAKEGVLTGYHDGTFRGDKTMTRYEMAQLVANAMTKEAAATKDNKQLIQKLAAEFTGELTKLEAKVNNTSDRVTTVENKLSFSASNTIRWVKWNNASGSLDYYKNGAVQNNFTLFAAAKVNENISANFKWAMLRQDTFGNPSSVTTSPNNNETNNLLQGEFTIRNFMNQSGTTLSAGRMVQSFGTSGFIAQLQGVDGVKLALGKQMKVELGAGDFNNPLSNYQKSYADTPTAPAASADYGGLYFKDAAWLKAAYKTSKATTVEGFSLRNTSGPAVARLYGFGLSTKAVPNMLFRADYVKNTAFDQDNTNLQYRFAYRGAEMAKPGSWGLNVDYGKAFARASFAWGDYNTTALYPKAGIQSWNISYERTLTKNVMLKLARSFDSKNPATGAKSLYGEWSRAQVEFIF